MNLHKSHQEQLIALHRKEFSCSELLESYFKRIEENKKLNIFLEVFYESAREQAKKVDLTIEKNCAGSLAGMVISIKDNICYKGHNVSASSKILEGFESIYSSTVVERLVAEGAIYYW